MTEEIKKEDAKVEIPEHKTEVKTEVKTDLSQNKKPERTRLEKLRFTKASIEAQIAAEEAENGIVITPEEDDSKPITKGDLKRIELENSKRSALQMADELPEDERQAVRELLETSIVPSGNPQKDYQRAYDLANSEKNRQIAEEGARKRTPVKRASTGGAPPKEEDQFVPTQAELQAAAMVGKKTPADIKAFVLKARAREK